MTKLSFIKAAAVTVAAAATFAAPAFAEGGGSFHEDKAGNKIHGAVSANEVSKSKTSVSSSTTQAERISRALDARRGR